MGYSGCLLGTHIVSDDAELRPLTPVSFYESHPQPPGSVIILAPGVDRQTFDVTVFSESRGLLHANWYVDRHRPTCDQAAGNCGLLIPSILQAEAMPAAAGSLRVVPAQPIHFPAERRCYTVDLYISENFQASNEDSHLPVRDGDVAFARWFVVRPSAIDANDLPSIRDCLREGQ